MDRFPIVRDDPPDSLLFQYVDGTGLLGIVNNSEIWVSDVRSMNDTGELEHGLNLIRDEGRKSSATDAAKTLLNRMLEIPGRLNSPVCASCFSANPDVLSQWRAYGADGSGYAIGFEPRTLLATRRFSGFSSSVASSEIEFELARIEYRPDEQRAVAAAFATHVLEYFDRRLPVCPISPLPAVAHFAVIDALRLVASWKSDAFREEEEWRLIASQASYGIPGVPFNFRTGRYGLTQYIRISFDNVSTIREIKCGPKRRADEKAVMSLLRQRGSEFLTVTHSAATYR